MKEKITRNIGLKSLSIIIAALVWLLIVNIDDPIITEKFRDVPVTIINDDVVLDLEQVYDVIQGETIDFTVEGRKSLIDKVKVRDFNVVADFNLISSYDTIQINISSPDYGNQITVVEGKYPMMKISREESMEKNFKVDVIDKGSVANGYYIGEKTASPNMVSVSGPKARVESVASIVVEVEVAGATESFSVKSIPKALDIDGNYINDLKLVLSENEVDTKIKLVQTKQVNLLVNPIGEVLEGYIMTNIEYEPKTVVIAGDNEEYRNFSYIAINESIVNATSTIEKEIDLQEYLPENVYLVGESTAVIKINVERVQTKSLTIMPKDLRIKNKLPSSMVKHVDTLPINIIVSGVAADITGLTAADIKPYIDLKDLKTNLNSKSEHIIPININPTLDITLVNKPVAIITISE